MDGFSNDLYFIMMHGVLHVRYLHDRPIFKTHDLSIRGIGIRETMPPSFISRPSTGDYLFMVFHDPVDFGRAVPRRRLSVGQAVIWRPGDAHHYGDAGHRWAHSWIHCAGRFMANTLKAADAIFIQPFDLADEPAVLRHLFYLHEALTRTAEPDPAIIRATLLLLIREATCSLRNPAAARRSVPPELVAAMKIINERYAEPLKLRQLAEAAGMSVPHFCTRFREQFGATAMATLVSRRMEVAGVLLRCTDAKVAMIGAQVGYPDPAHFSKAFTAHFDVSPSRARGQR